MEYNQTNIPTLLFLTLSLVLILVLMEYNQTQFERLQSSMFFCLNPCFNGIQSNFTEIERKRNEYFVLILVLMEYNQTKQKP